MSALLRTERIARIRELLGPAVLLRWPSGTKGDRRKWKHLELADMTDDYLEKLEANCNVGVALGKVSDGLVTIDFDQDQPADSFLEANPLLANTLRTRARRGCNIWIRCSGNYPASCKLKSPSGKDVGEWRPNGAQTIISGTHPDGVPYQFVVERPVITLSYDAIIWPTTFLKPTDATESQRVRGVRENEVVGAVACADEPVVLDNGCAEIKAFLARNDIVAQVAPTKEHQNNSSLFKLARVVKSYESEVGRPATNAEKESVFDCWAEHARPFWRPGLTRDDYYAEFLEAYSYAQIGLDENPIETAVSRAKATALPNVPGFTDQRIRLLSAICRELQNITRGSPFFLPTRKLGEILGAHWTQVARWLRALEVLKVIHLAPGEVRKRGGIRSPRYLYGPRKHASFLPRPFIKSI